MTISKKQLEANRKNAQKGGVKTPEGKEVVKHNALKHGLLAKEVVITVGEDAECLEEFNALLGDLKTQLIPEGTLEEMLVEKIAVSYWRLRRAYKYEVGLIRQNLDTTTNDYYNQTDWQDRKINKTEEEIEQEIEQKIGRIKYWKKDKRDLQRMHKEGKPLEEIYDWEENWKGFYDEVHDLIEEEGLEFEDLEPEQLIEFLTDKVGWNDDLIWKALVELCDEKVEYHKRQIKDLEKEKEKNRLKIEVLKRLGNIPSKEELERLLRYEGSLERQFYKALNQLERIQRLRLGDKISAPVEVDLNVNTE